MPCPDNGAHLSNASASCSLPGASPPAETPANPLSRSMRLSRPQRPDSASAGTAPGVVLGGAAAGSEGAAPSSSGPGSARPGDASLGCSGRAASAVDRAEGGGLAEGGVGWLPCNVGPAPASGAQTPAASFAAAPGACGVDEATA